MAVRRSPLISNCRCRRDLCFKGGGPGRRQGVVRGSALFRNFRGALLWEYVDVQRGRGRKLVPVFLWQLQKQHLEARSLLAHSPTTLALRAAEPLFSSCRCRRDFSPAGLLGRGPGQRRGVVREGFCSVGLFFENTLMSTEVGGEGWSQCFCDSFSSRRRQPAAAAGCRRLPPAAAGNRSSLRGGLPNVKPSCS